MGTRRLLSSVSTGAEDSGYKEYVIKIVRYS